MTWAPAHRSASAPATGNTTPEKGLAAHAIEKIEALFSAPIL
jgi:hypothetical protein